MEDKGRKFTVLRALRVQLDIRQIRIAQKIGVTQAEVSYLENGWIKTLSPDRAQKIAEMLGVEPDEVLMDYEDYLRKKLLKEADAQHNDKKG